MKSYQLAETWKELIIGQDHAIDKIVPYVTRAMAGLNAPNRPIGVFFLMGPTGTGKTLTSETLAEVLHGSDKNILRIDCGEFQMEHEVAKLIGAPPGYLGHRETQAALSQNNINRAASDKSSFSIVLFDEIEKGHASLWRILLGILDTGTIKLGDNNNADFTKSIIFMSSNVGANEMSKFFGGAFGFINKPASANSFHESDFKNIEKIGISAMGKKFPPEFANRVDEVITYRPLDSEALKRITKMELSKIQRQIHIQLGMDTFKLDYSDDALDFLTAKGTSLKFGARELKRIVNRYLMNPLADDVIDGKIPPGSYVYCSLDTDHINWKIETPGPFEMIEEQRIAVESMMTAETATKRVRKKAN